MSPNKQIRSTDNTCNQSNKTRQPPVSQGPCPSPAPSDSAHLNFVAPLQKNTTLISMRDRKTTALCDT